MTPQKVLDDFIKEINSRIEKVYYPNRIYEDVNSFFTIGFQNLVDYKPSDFRDIYDHFCFVTKPYRDESSAAYKLMIFLELTTKSAKEIYWRYSPKIINYTDDTKYEKFVCKVRFSIFPKLNQEYQ